MTKKLKILAIISVFAALLALCACQPADDVEAPDKTVSVTLLDGEHYRVLDGNKKQVDGSGAAVFNVRLDRGYKITGFYGDRCEYSDDISFEQTVTFSNVEYKSVARLETSEMETSRLNTNEIGHGGGYVEITALLGAAGEDEYFSEDRLSLSATPDDGYRFLCWSAGNYIDEGGSFYSYDAELIDFDFRSTPAIYANFKNLKYAGNRIIYVIGNTEGTELEQDCTSLLAHHARANTYTAVDIRGFGIDCDSRLLAGWRTEDGEYVGLGSRVTVTDERATVLYPVWKEYSPVDDFEVEDGKLLRYNGDADEVVIPRSICGDDITAIGSGAFTGCTATTYYIPDSVTAVEDDAFKDCGSLTDLYMSDNISRIADKCFTGCKSFTTVHINANLRPRYTNHYYCGKMEQYDSLYRNRDSGVLKIILMGGSSVRYGYSTNKISSLFKDDGLDIEVYNLGFRAHISEYWQFRLCDNAISSGDIFLHAPEPNYPQAWSGKTGKSVLTNDVGFILSGQDEFILCENNWQFVSNVTVKHCCNIFDSFNSFNKNRMSKSQKSYSDYFVFNNGSGDTRLSESGETILSENGADKNFHSVGNIALDISQVQAPLQLAIEYIYSGLIKKGVKVFFGFPSLNKNFLADTYAWNSDDEDNCELKIVADKYTEDIKAKLKDIDVCVLLSQYSSIYDGRHFCNSDFHLGAPFRDEHTRKVITALIEARAGGGAA